MRAACALAVYSIGCSADYPRPEHVTRPAPASASAELQLTESARRLQLLLQQLAHLSNDPETRDALRVVGMQPGPVPSFDLMAASGARRYRSRELVGKRPFVAVFFATWCDYCAGELQAVQQAFRQVGTIPVIPLSADGPETWERVPGYLASFGIGEPAVRATDYPLFSASYNPADVLPSLVIVGKDGSLVDYLHGYDPAHAARLTAAVRIAKSTGPLQFPRAKGSLVGVQLRREVGEQ